MDEIQRRHEICFAIMDNETRFWIVSRGCRIQVKHDARKLFQLAKKANGKRLMTMITDGLSAYHMLTRKSLGLFVKFINRFLTALPRSPVNRRLDRTNIQNT